MKIMVMIMTIIIIIKITFSCRRVRHSKVGALHKRVVELVCLIIQMMKKMKMKMKKKMKMKMIDPASFLQDAPSGYLNLPSKLRSSSCWTGRAETPEFR